MLLKYSYHYRDHHRRRNYQRAYLDKVRGEVEHVPRQLPGAHVGLVRDLLHRAQVRHIPQHLVDCRLRFLSDHYHYHHMIIIIIIVIIIIIFSFIAHRCDSLLSTSLMAMCGCDRRREQALLAVALKNNGNAAIFTHAEAGADA